VEKENCVIVSDNGLWASIKLDIIWI
jgi:hypothetical protein